MNADEEQESCMNVDAEQDSCALSKVHASAHVHKHKYFKMVQLEQRSLQTASLFFLSRRCSVA